MVAADSITDSQLSHGSPPISRDVFKKRKANLLRKLKQCKIYAPRRSQWIHQCEDEDGCSSRLRDKPLLDIKTLTDRFSHFQAWSADDETSLSAASSSPRSVLKNKESDSGDDDDDCFCCSKQVTEEAFADAVDSDDYSDGFSMFDEEDQKKDEDVCPLCTEKMDATDLLFELCSCGYKMCLFCYKKLSEGTGACPVCRKKYEPQQTSSNSGGVAFQQRGHAPVPLSSSFQALNDDDTA